MLWSAMLTVALLHSVEAITAVQQGKSPLSFSSNKDAQTYSFRCCEKFLHHANCQTIETSRGAVNVFHLAFVNYHKCHNHQKTTTDDISGALTFDTSIFTCLCSATLSSLPLFITHYTTPALLNYSTLTPFSLLYMSLNFIKWIPKVSCKLMLQNRPTVFLKWKNKIVIYFNF